MISRPSEIKLRSNRNPNHLAAAKELLCRNLQSLKPWISSVKRNTTGHFRSIIHFLFTRKQPMQQFILEFANNQQTEKFQI